MMREVECPDRGCGHVGVPVKGRERLRAKTVWLCESCCGRLPFVKTPPTRKRRAER